MKDTSKAAIVPDKVSKSTEVNIVEICEVPSVSNRNRRKTGFIIGVVVLGVIAAGVLPAVIVSQTLGTTTSNSSYINTLTSSTATMNTPSIGSTSSPATPVCPTNMCSYSTWYTLTSSGYCGVEHVNINCTETLSNITAFIYVGTAVGGSYANQYNTFWNGTVNQGYSTTSSQIIYSWSIIPGQTISSTGFPYYVEAQFQLQGINQTVSNDTYTVITQPACKRYFHSRSKQVFLSYI